MNSTKTRRLVLGEGEAIGHTHVLESNSEFEFSKTEDHTRWVIGIKAVLTHDERIALISSNLQEILDPEIIEDVIKKQNRPLTIYWGMEASSSPTPLLWTTASLCSSPFPSAAPKLNVRVL